MTTRKNHRWGEKQEFPLAHKSERECLNGCGITKVTRHEIEGGRDIYWTEFWRGEEQVHDIRSPTCETVGETVSE